MLKEKLIFRGKNISYAFIHVIGLAIMICVAMCISDHYPNFVLRDCVTNIIALITLIPLICLARYFSCNSILFSDNEKDDATKFDLLCWIIGIFIIPIVLITFLKELSL